VSGYDPYNSLLREEMWSRFPSRKPVIEQVLYLIRFWELRGCTDDELEEWLDERHQTVSARRRELVLCGAVRDSGMKRKTRSGTLARVWVYAG